MAPNEATSLIKKLAQLNEEHGIITQRSATLEMDVAKLRKQVSLTNNAFHTEDSSE